jgi:hypothetical protein
MIIILILVVFIVFATPTGQNLLKYFTSRECDDSSDSDEPDVDDDDYIKNKIDQLNAIQNKA